MKGVVPFILLDGLFFFTFRLLRGPDDCIALGGHL
jgi:hypothetical protein